MLSTTIVRDFIEEVVGEDALPLVLFLKDKKNISEFVIAEKLNISIHQVRNMLYRMSQHNLINSVRKKDKKKGWYIYYWSLTLNEIELGARSFTARKIEEFREKLAREESEMFFVCPNGCTRVKYETAMEKDFKCSECGSLFVKDENRKTIINLKARIEELEQEMKRFKEEEAKKKAVKKRVAIRPAKKKEKAIIPAKKREIAQIKKKREAKAPKKKAKSPASIRKKAKAKVSAGKKKIGKAKKKTGKAKGRKRR